MLSDGSYYLIYSRAGGPGGTGGLIQGSASIEDPNFVSGDGLDFSMEGAGVTASPIEASFPGLLFQGSLRPGTPRESSFRMTPAHYSHVEPTLAALAGSYPGQVAFSLGTRPATFTVTASGLVSTVINGCSISGTAAPRRDVNAYDLSVTFAGAPCVFPHAQFTGVAYYADSDKTLHAAVRNASRTQAIVFVGSRQ